MERYDRRDFESKFLLRKSQIGRLGGLEQLKNIPYLTDIIIYPGGFGEFFYLAHLIPSERYIDFWIPIFRGNRTFFGNDLCRHWTATEDAVKIINRRYGLDLKRFIYLTLNPRVPKNLINSVVAMDCNEPLSRITFKIYTFFKLDNNEREQLVGYIDDWKNECTVTPSIFELEFIKPYCLKFKADISRQTQEALHLFTFKMEDYSTFIAPLHEADIGYRADEPAFYKDLFERGDFRGVPRTYWPRLKKNYLNGLD